MAFTFFFRDWDVLDLILQHVIPEVRECSKVRVWDAGCATGEEAYSLAMQLAEDLGLFGMRSIEILATDHEENNNFGTLVSEGIYPVASVSGCPRQDLIAKYMLPGPGQGQVQVIDDLRRCISYRRHDLLSFDAVGRGFHLILCKNVLVHFNPDQQAAVLRMFYDSLLPGGFVALDRMQALPTGLSGLFSIVQRGENLLRKV